jgi:redox-sensitive bicupin YhaK (pirin superfamily)
MKFILRKSEDRWHKQDSWKKSAYSFVPYQTHFGELCGFADDVVEAGQGFGMHPHQNMEISTLVFDGAQTHKDNTGSEGTVDKNSVQTMSAGTGIMHSEYNASTTESFHSYQIWIYPKLKDVAPRHDQFVFKQSDKRNTILLVISPDKRNGTAGINQDAFFSLLELEQGKSVEYTLHLEGNGVYAHVVSGKARISGQVLAAGDAIGIYETDKISVEAMQDAQFIFVEVPMQRGINLAS